MSLRRSIDVLGPLLALGLLGCGSSARPEGPPAAPVVQPMPTPTPTPPPPPAPQPSACVDCCTTADECTWGEIAIEITQPSDCMCLLGCPSIAMSRTTFARRRQQYGAHCTPRQDGHGRACPIDDCAAPPPIACTAGHCAVGRPTPPGPTPPSGSGATES